VSFKSRLPALVALICAVAAPAGAGEPGPTSSGTLSISITIPPHFRTRIGSSPQPGRDSAGETGICLATQAALSYHVALVASGGPGPAPDRGIAASAGHCLLVPAGPDRGTASGPVLLLVVPD
jgi:hypothetical protein